MSAAKFDRKAAAARGMARIVPSTPMVSVGLGTCGIGGRTGSTAIATPSPIASLPATRIV